MSRIHLYESISTGDGKFQVKYIGDEIGPSIIYSEHYYDFTDTPIPLFKHIRGVSVQDDGVMHCDCYQFQREGIPCAHQGSVAALLCYQYSGKEFIGFTHHDISVHWWSAYMHLAYKTTTPPQMQNLFHSLANNDVCGPCLRIALRSDLVLHEPKQKHTAHECVKNYHHTDIELGRYENVMSQTITNNLKSEEAEFDDDIYVALSDDLNDSTSAHLEDMFSRSILNAKFYPSEKRTQPPPMARDSLKQMWEENCAHADNIGLDAVKKLESTMNEFSNWCNEWSRKNDLLVQHGKRKKGLAIWHGNRFV